MLPKATRMVRTQKGGAFCQDLELLLRKHSVLQKIPWLS